MDEKDRWRAVQLTCHLEYFVPGVFVLHQNGFTDEDIASFYNAPLREVLKARLTKPAVEQSVFPDKMADQLVERIKSKHLPED